MANQFLAARGVDPIRSSFKTNAPTARIASLHDSEWLSALITPLARIA